MGFLNNIFRSGSGKSNTKVSSEAITAIPEPPKEEKKTMDLDEIMKFVTELKSCYFNDNFKNQSEFISNSQSEEKAQFLRKKIAIEKIAEKQIEALLEEIRAVEKEIRSIWGKSNYSFYEELEKQKMEEAHSKLFQILLKLPIINVKPELDSIIISRIEKARNDWGISTAIPIPENMALKIVSFDTAKESYSIGAYKFDIASSDSKKAMISDEQAKAIAKLKLDVSFSNPANQLLVRCATASRLQIERLSKTAILDENWRLDSNNIKFFVVQANQLEQFLKGILQVILNFDEYVEITLFNMNQEMLYLLNSVFDDECSNMAKVTNPATFILAERSLCYKDNYKVCYFKKRKMPEVLKFKPYGEVCSYFK